jgi:hypothetical protein
MYTVKTLLLLIIIGFVKIGWAQVPPPPRPPGDSTNDEEKIFTRVEEEASFPGGGDAWKKFLERNLHSDIAEKNNAPCGQYTTVIKFIVGKNGILNSIAAETKLGYGMEEEVIRVIEKSGKWKPAVQNGRIVNAYRRQPVTFMVIDDDITINTKVPYTLFTGTDNQLTVDVKKVKPEDLQLSISKGTIKQTADGRYIVRVNEPGRVVIELYNTKKNKSIGAASFEVKQASGNVR